MISDAGGVLKQYTPPNTAHILKTEIQFLKFNHVGIFHYHQLNVQDTTK